MGEGMADCESAAVPTDKLQPAIPGQPRTTRRRPQSIQQVVQSGARLTVAHCPQGSVHTSASGAPKAFKWPARGDQDVEPPEAARRSRLREPPERMRERRLDVSAS